MAELDGGVAYAEEVKELPTESSSVATSGGVPDTTAIMSVASESRSEALVSSNVTTPPEEIAAVTLPQLEKSQRVGYKLGKEITPPLVCCNVGGFLIEENAAYDYLLMANAAESQGILLPLSAAFRTMEFQTQLYNERVAGVDAKGRPILTPAGQKYGVAAKPGFSNHQSGIALDIGVGMTVDDYKNRRYTAAFLWLKGDPDTGKGGNAELFGFNHSDGAPVNEPWHWIHPDRKIVGIQAFEKITKVKVATFNTASGAMNNAQSGALRLVFNNAHDLSTVLSRAKGMPGTSRAEFNAAQAVFSAQQGTGYAGNAANISQVAPTAADLPPGFDPKTIGPLTFNFDTGLWGDNKKV